MKKHFLLPITLITLCVLISGCYKHTDKEQVVEELTQYMFDTALLYSSIGDNTTPESYEVVKSVNETDELERIPQWMADYLEEYLNAEFIQDLNEEHIIDELSNDKTISFEQKKMIIDAIAIGYYGKCLLENVFAASETKAVSCAEKCYNSYNRKAKRALVLAVFTTGVSAVLGQIEGITLAVAGYALAMGQAEDDYYDCLDNCNQIIG